MPSEGRMSSICPEVWATDKGTPDGHHRGPSGAEGSTWDGAQGPAGGGSAGPQGRALGSRGRAAGRGAMAS